MEKEEEARGVESEVAVDVTSPSRTETKSGKGEGGSWKLNAQTISDDFEANSPETKNKLVQGYATSQRDMIEDFLQIDKKFKEDSSVGEEAHLPCTELAHLTESTRAPWSSSGSW